MTYHRTVENFHARYVTTRELVGGYEHTSRLAKQYAPRPPVPTHRDISDIEADISHARSKHLPTRHLLKELKNARHAALGVLRG